MFSLIQAFHCSSMEIKFILSHCNWIGVPERLLLYPCNSTLDLSSQISARVFFIAETNIKNYLVDIILYIETTLRTAVVVFFLWQLDTVSKKIVLHHLDFVACAVFNNIRKFRLQILTKKMKATTY